MGAEDTEEIQKSAEEIDQLLEEDSSNYVNELGLMSVDEAEDPTIKYEITDRSFVQILEDDLETGLFEDTKERAYNSIRNIEIGTVNHGTALNLGGFGTTLYGALTPGAEAFIFLGNLGCGAGLLMTYGDRSIDMTDYLPEFELEHESREYHPVAESLMPLLEGSEKVEIMGSNIEGVPGEYYEDILEDFHLNQPEENNNFQVLRFEEREDLWEYKVEIYTSGANAEGEPNVSIRGITSEYPVKHIDGENTVEGNMDKLYDGLKP